jgi:diacylglycerol kinase (ATP)
MRNQTLRQSFSHAFDGLSHVLWTQKHVRTQLMMVILVFLLSYVMKLEMTKVLFMLSAVTFVLVAELFNTAIEVVVNMITQAYHPMAKIAKDVAAAGVLIASFYAVLVAGGIFINAPKINYFFFDTHLLRSVNPPNMLVVLLLCFAVLSILVMLGKSRKGHGSILSGGAVSGHAAVAFMLFSAVALYSQFNPYASVCALVLAVLVAQSRVEGKIHSLLEVILGGTVGIALMILLTIFGTHG